MMRDVAQSESPEGSAEELINLRQTKRGWEAVGRKKAVREGLPYEQVYVHEFAGRKNYIGVASGQAVWFGTEAQGVYESKDQTVCEVGGGAEFQHLSNILLVKTPVSILKSIFFDGVYQETVDVLPDIPALNFSKKYKELKDSDKYRAEFSFYHDETIPPHWAEEAKSAILAKFRQCKNSEPGYDEGYAWVCTTFGLYDGTETKPSSPQLIELGEYSKSKYDHKHDYDYDHRNCLYFVTPQIKYLEDLSIAVDNRLDARYHETVKRINVYATPLYSHYNVEEVNVACLPELAGQAHEEGKAILTDRIIPRKVYDKAELKKMLFFQVLSVEVVGMDEPPHTAEKVKFDDALPTNKTMTVDGSGWLNTLGDMFVYNNRLHLYNLKQSFVRSGRVFPDYTAAGGVKRAMKAVVYARTQHQTLQMTYPFTCYADASASGLMTAYLPAFISFPDSRAYQLEIYWEEDDPVRKRHVLVARLDLTPSSTYNFAFFYEDNKRVEFDPTAYVSFPAEETAGYSDLHNIIVSAPVNPFYFPVEHSYGTPGEMVGMAVATEQISESQVGQFPLYLFTKEGIYALQVGEGMVLYSNMVPISAAVATGKMLQTRDGVVFAARDGLKLIVGRDVVDLSQVLGGVLDRSLRACKGYGVTDNDQLYHIAAYLSACPFEEYVQGACLGYDLKEEELIVSNAAYAYSYVFGLKTKTWHKIGQVFDRCDRCWGFTRRTNNEGAAVCDIYDLREEVAAEMTVHLQTRPFQLGSLGFKKIHGACLRGDFKPVPVENHYYGVYLFGANDLINWHPLAVRQFGTPAIQAALSRTRQSFRYYVLLTGGVVQPRHAIGHLELDAETRYDRG